MTTDTAALVARLRELAEKATPGVRQKTGPKPRPVADRFEEKVLRPEDGNITACWLWRDKSKSDAGYPLMFMHGRMRRASQIAWELLHKTPFPPGLHACHMCDNPGCVNPHHIWPGTPADNTADAKSKGRPLGAPRREFCKSGHQLTAANTRPATRGGRQCLTCRRQSHIKLTEQRRQVRAALKGEA